MLSPPTSGSKNSRGRNQRANGWSYVSEDKWVISDSRLQSICGKSLWFAFIFTSQRLSHSQIRMYRAKSTFVTFIAFCSTFLILKVKEYSVNNFSVKPFAFQAMFSLYEQLNFQKIQPYFLLLIKSKHTNGSLIKLCKR